MDAPGGRDELSQTLRQLRLAAGLTAAQVAQRTGFSQSKISRFENGRFVPPPAAAEAIARAVGASAADRRRVAALAADVREQTSARLVLMRDAAKVQQRIGQVEVQSEHIATFGTVLIPGLLQTEEYMRVVFESAIPSAGEVDAATAGRLSRQRQMSPDGPRRYTQIVTEGALTWNVGGPDLMARQLDHLVTLAGLGGAVRVGVIPMTSPVRVFPMAGFDLYDDGRAVLMGTFTATAFMTQPVDTAAYRTLFEALVTAASFGDAAMPTFERIAASYRDQARSADAQLP